MERKLVQKMSKKVAISDGHELTTAGKRTPPIVEIGGRVIHENEFNKAVALKLERELKRCGIETINVSATDNDTLDDRVNRANAADADIFVAIHYNAYDGKFDDYDPEGLSIHIYGTGGEAEKLAKSVHKYLIQGTNQIDRGIKVNNFYVLRKTNMPAILTENGFMDNKKEALLMIDEEFQEEVATEHAKGICDYFNIPYIEEATTPDNAPIMITATSTVGQAQEWAKSKNASEEFINIAPIFYKVAAAAGVDPTGAYAQSAKETGYGKFGGVLDATYKNPCGMKITAGGGNYDPDAHKRFNTWEEGITAQIDHLALYAGAEGYPKESTPDPRHFPYIRGKAPTFEALSGNWAGSATYGSSIVNMMNQIKATEAPESTYTDDEVEQLTIQLASMTDRALKAENEILNLEFKLDAAENKLAGIELILKK